jgi:hypothetical protein
MGYYLNNSQCFDCPPLANCLYCNQIDNTVCIRCLTGYYSDVGTCKACPQTGCSTCISDLYCTSVKPGYYLEVDITDALTGDVQPCGGLCATCILTDLTCLTCQPGANLIGTSCISSNNYEIAIVATVLGLITGASSNYELGKLLSVTSRFLNELGVKAFKFPNFNKFQANSLVKSIKKGSVVIDLAVNQASLTENSVDPNTAVVNAQFSDVSVLSHSIVTNSDSASSVNLGLVLGVSIPLGILRNYWLI